jgi:2-polyprenyl-6-methoxyphenol hydroxylase-like FAD-dependent oxidoreductase
MSIKKLHTRCCIVGGGPAGIMLGFLLARAGVKTTILEKWADFFRDFRGDTIHPSTLEILNELGLLEEFLKIPHNETTQLGAEIGGHKVILADFSRLKTTCPFIAFTPQWNFLNFMTEKAKAYPHFNLLMDTEGLELMEEEGRVIGVLAKNKEETFEIYSEVVIGADGRHSMVREKSHLKVKSLGAPMDVLWFRLSRKESDIKQSLGKMDLGRILIMIERGDYWQCGFLIHKGDFARVQAQGLEAFHLSILEVAPTMDDRINELTSWEQIKLLTVAVERLEKWHRPGLLCIGDAAHAMSPIGGVGINLAIQDAVATANILTPAFLKGVIKEDDLAAVQKRRALPTKIVQKLQVLIQNRIIGSILGNPTQLKLPFVLKLLQWVPILRRIPAYLIGIGIRPEHVKSLSCNKKGHIKNICP